MTFGSTVILLGSGSVTENKTSTGYAGNSEGMMANRRPKNAFADITSPPTRVLNALVSLTNSQDDKVLDNDFDLVTSNSQDDYSEFYYDFTGTSGDASSTDSPVLDYYSVRQ